MRLSRPFVLAFVAGLLSFLQVRVIGYMSMIEPVFLMLAPLYLYGRHRRIWSGKLRTFLLLALAWLGSGVLTDAVRGTNVQDSLKGSVTVVLWMACLICVYVMFATRLAAIKWYALGLACSSFISLYYFQPGTLIGRAADKGGDVSSVLDFRSAYVGVFGRFVAAFAILAFGKWPRIVIGVMVAFAIVCFVFGSRSAGGMYLVASLMTYYFYRQAARTRGGSHAAPMSKARRLRLGLGFAAVCVMTIAGYQVVASRGWLGQLALARTAETTDTKIGVMAGRVAIVSGALAIIDSPLLGYGYWAKDTHGYFERGCALIGLPDVSAWLATQPEMLMPGHSYIVSSWVFYGLWGGVFWIYVLWFLIRFVLRYLPGDLEYLPYALITVVGLMWSVMFSPFGQRPATAAALVFLVVLAERAERRRLPQTPAGAGAPAEGAGAALTVAGASPPD